MGRYQIKITKRSSEAIPASHLEKLNVVISGLGDNYAAQTSIDTLAKFTIFEPPVRSIRVESLKHFQAGSCSKSESIKTHEDKAEEKGEVFYKSRNEGKLIIYSQGDSKSTDKVLPEGCESSDLDMRSIGSFLQINTMGLIVDEKVTLGMIVDSVTDTGKPILQANLDLANQNEPTLVGSGLAAEPSSTSVDVTSQLENLSAIENNGEELESHVDNLDQNQNQDVVNNETSEPEPFTVQGTPGKSVVMAIADIVVRIEFEAALQKEISLKTSKLVENVAEDFQDSSNPQPQAKAILGDPEMEAGFVQTTAALAGDFRRERTLEDEQRKLEQSTRRRELMRQLIQDRLLAYGLSTAEAETITTAWNSAYVQHRPFSYRIIHMEHFKSSFGRPPALLKSQKFALSFLRHLEILQGIVDSGTCTAIESTLFLLLPHFKMQQSSSSNPSNPDTETINSREAMQEWVRVIFTAAHQLKPMGQVSVTALVHKELKLISKPLHSIKKIARKIKNKSIETQKQLDRLERKLLQRIEPRPEWMAEVMQKRFQGNPKKAFEEFDVKDNNKSAENLFENSIHIGVGKHGLLIKNNLGDKWFPFSNLNFLERRAMFLGMTDHLFSSLDVVLRTLRHMVEMYTPGYPNNILSRVTALFDAVKATDIDGPLIQLDPATRMRLYTNLYMVGLGMERFDSVLCQMVTMTKDIKNEIQGTSFRSTSMDKVIDNILKKHPNVHLVVPMATLCVDGMANLNLRAFEFEEEQGSWTKPETNEVQIVEKSPEPEKIQADVNSDDSLTKDIMSQAF